MPTIKRAVSLPESLDAELKRLTRSTRSTYSGLVRDAVAFYLQNLKKARLLQAYAAYYSKAEARTDSALAQEWARLSAGDWP